jgi:hypothetical protein
MSAGWRNVVEDSKRSLAQRPLGSPDRAADRFDLCQYIRGGNAQNGGNIDEFDDIESSFSGLIFGDERLRFAEHRRQVSLRHTLLLSDAHEQGLEALLPWRAQGFRHSEQGSLEDEGPFR